MATPESSVNREVEVSAPFTVLAICGCGFRWCRSVIPSASASGSRAVELSFA